jgi:hypothetical protein
MTELEITKKLEKMLEDGKKENEANWAVARADKKMMQRYIDNQSIEVYRGSARFTY